MYIHVHPPEPTSLHVSMTLQCFFKSCYWLKFRVSVLAVAARVDPTNLAWRKHGSLGGRGIVLRKPSLISTVPMMLIPAAYLYPCDSLALKHIQHT